MDDKEYQNIEAVKRQIRQARRKRKQQQRLSMLTVVLLVFVLAGVLLGLHRHRLENLPPKYKMDADIEIVNVAKEELGNIGGEKFWAWYGFNERVDWCACFVSWAEDKVGYIDEGKAPMFCAVADGVYWFQDRDQWLDNKATPEPGDIIFFDWNSNGGGDHVGIVSNVVGDTIITIEGNSANLCRHKRYKVGNKCIMGYGHIEQ